MSAAGDPSKALVIEDDPGYAKVLQKRLTQETEPSFDVTWRQQLRGGLEQLASGDIDIVVLDLLLPDSQGLDTLIKVRAQAPDVPVVVLTGLDDETLALEAVRRGAQDYLVKGEVTGKTLPRVLRSAMERHRVQQLLRNLAFLDELTGLYNRRGFLHLAEHHMKLAQRAKQGFLLLFADLDNLKQLNDEYGHAEGDQALKAVAAMLKQTVRGSDVLARFGGDEFAALALRARQEHVDALRSRVYDAVNHYNASSPKPYIVSVSLGAAYFDPECPMAFEELLAKADQSLYYQKTQKLPRPKV